MIPSKDPNQFIKENYDQLTRCAIHIIRYRVNSDVIVEIISDFYIKLKTYDLLNRYNPAKGAFNTYIYSSLKNLIIDKFSKKKLDQVELNEKIHASDDHPGSTIDLERFIDGLTGMEREVCISYVKDIDRKELSVKLKMTVSGLTYYRRLLRDRWAEYQGTI